MPIILVDHGMDFCRLIDLVVLVVFGVSLHNMYVIGFNLSEDACISTLVYVGIEQCVQGISSGVACTRFYEKTESPFTIILS